ncbi:MAG: hypothetical protein HYX28_03720 [Candidatus Koribacter versatilis]|uniref:Uncharacterized protein n=1 Tax=Candidatus Korobacter versatilis TaxID=658062 RepID=A0A932A704_9BACT|nr:hypothetical protein [Candidatus Koribacter versatilis]
MAETFCAECTAASSDHSPGNISTVNGVGRQFYGAAEECPQCGSVVRTLWFTLIDVPIYPMGSYRYKSAEGKMKKGFDAWLSPKPRFWARKTALHGKQVLTTFAIGLGMVALLGGAYYVYVTFIKTR